MWESHAVKYSTVKYNTVKYIDCSIIRSKKVQSQYSTVQYDGISKVELGWTRHTSHFIDKVELELPFQL